MLNILKFAHEKGWEEGQQDGWQKGQQDGWQKGRIETAREMVIASLEESFGVVPAYIADEIMSLSRQDVLRALLKQAFKCREISEFEKMLRLASKKAEG